MYHMSAEQQKAPSLRGKAAKAGAWLAGLRMTQRVLSTLRLVVLARLLSPADFGLFGVAMLAISFLETFTQTGTEVALIRHKDPSKAFINTAWAVQVLRAVALTILLLLFSAPIAHFFKTSEAAGLLRLLAVSIFIRGFTSLGIVFMRRDLQYRKLCVYSMTNTLVELVVTVICALVLRNAWALVWGRVIGQLAACAVSYGIAPYWPTRTFDRSSMKELYGFGRWIFGSSLLVYLLREGDDIVLGRIAGAEQLGLYQMSYRLSNLPATQITHVVSRITLPAYASLQDQPARLRAVFLETLQLVCLVSIPLAIGIICVAPSLTAGILGASWISATPAIQWLAFFGLIRSIGANSGPVFLAMGRPEIETKLLLGKFLLLAAIIFPLVLKYQIMGACWAVVINAVLAKPVTDYLVLRLIRCRVREMVHAQIWPLLGALLMAAVLWALDFFVPMAPGIAKMCMQIVTGALVYGGFLLWADRTYDLRLWKGLRKVMKGLRPDA
ncbi:MAG: lipopolysaccharide biosynthesis protein [Spartobacteria bacterium]|nr:lipopolysaccharide biosynthesis protein [Spartobacteria bacterium]